MAQESQLETPTCHRDPCKSAIKTHQQTDVLAEKARPAVEHDTCDSDCSKEEEDAYPSETHACPHMQKFCEDHGELKGNEHHMHEKGDQGIKYVEVTQIDRIENVMQQIDQALLYIDNCIERNTLSMTIFTVTNMIGFTVLSSLVILTLNALIK